MFVIYSAVREQRGETINILVVLLKSFEILPNVQVFPVPHPDLIYTSDERPARAWRISSASFTNGARTCSTSPGKSEEPSPSKPLPRANAAAGDPRHRRRW